MHYRFYEIFGPRIMRSETHVCASDEAAASKAVALLIASDPRRCDTVEFWQGTRLVSAVTRQMIKIAG